MLRWLARGTAVLFLLGLVLRLSVQDRVPYLAALFYALPLPVLLILAGMTAALMRRLNRRFAARVWGLTTLAATLWCVAATGRWHPPAESHVDPIRILCWNTHRGKLGWDRVSRVINDLQPDIAGLVEAGKWSEQRRAFWHESCPGYHVSMLGGGVVCLTKEPAGEAIAVRLPVQGEYRQLDVSARGERVTLFIVDMKSNPFRSRQEALQQLAADANAQGDRPVVILGDFNTPADSVHFGALRAGHRQAFETAGRGYLATWPVPLPVLCLDHVWVNAQVAITSCRHEWTAASDHRPVVAEVTVVP